MSVAKFSSPETEVERTLLHDRDVLLCGGHLYSILSVLVDPGEGVGIHTLSSCGWSSKLKFKVRRNPRRARSLRCGQAKALKSEASPPENVGPRPIRADVEFAKGH
jgi:hypothetical protein